MVRNAVKKCGVWDWIVIMISYNNLCHRIDLEAAELAKKYNFSITNSADIAQLLNIYSGFNDNYDLGMIFIL